MWRQVLSPATELVAELLVEMPSDCSLRVGARACLWTLLRACRVPGGPYSDPEGQS